MNEEKFLETLGKYLNTEKVFIKNKARAAEFAVAVEISEKLFSNNKVEIKDDPLQMGAQILRIEGDDMVVCGDEGIQQFMKIIALADNFEIYPISNSKIRFAAVFQNVLTRI